MKGISPSLYRELRNTLLSCGPFESDAQLKAVFVNADISPWRDDLPQADSAAARVDALIDYLIDRRSASRKNALVLFLRVLGGLADPGDICHQDLARVADWLEREIEQSETGIPARQLGVHYPFEVGVRRLLERLGKSHPRYADVLTYQQRLETNLTAVRSAGDTRATKIERSETVAQLNQLTKSLLDVPFSELALVPEPSERLLTGQESVTLPTQLPPGRLTQADVLQVIEWAAEENWPLLDLAGRGLREVPPAIGRLTGLQRLDLSDNQLTALPSEIANLENLERLDLRYNPFLPIPPEILERVGEPFVIIDYYLESQSEGTGPRPLNEVKVILVGQGGVGKTSLVKRLIENAFDPHENMTKGINVRRWRVPVDGRSVRLNIWDFGGQEIMHATHQFFLTRRSLYLLVLDARKGEQESNVEYWLKLTQSFGEDSPIVVVVNKVDERPLDLNRRGLQEKYPTIRAFVNTSCKDGTGIDELLNTIKREIDALPHVHTPWLRSWFIVKRRLERMKQNYIPYDTYYRLCADAGITEERDQHTLAGYLHDLGIVLNYRDDPRLEETNILNPEWVTRAVYQILNNHALFQSNGVLKRSQLRDILDSKRYPSHKYNFIIGILQKFELCFPLNGAGGKSYLIPDLLPREQPYVNWPEPGRCLLFQYSYQVLPSSVISRFIVRMHTYVARNTCWRTGAVLAHQGNQALIKADLEERKVTISIKGNEGTRRELLAIIRSNFDHIHRTISRIEPMAQVPIPDHPDIAVDYQHLITLEQLGQETFIPTGLSELVGVKRMLDAVDAARAAAPPETPVDREERTATRATAPPEISVGPQDLISLRQLLATHFDSEELRTLCFDLGVEYDDLPGEGKASKARELIGYLDRRGRVQDLIEAGKSLRPDIAWEGT